MEEIRRRIYLRHILTFIILHHRGKLLRITDHQQLYATERTIVPAVFPQGHVDRIQKVCADHGDFVNDKKVEGADDLGPFPSEAPVALRHLIFGDEFLDVRQIWT